MKIQLTLLVIIVSIVCSLFFWPSDEKRITKNLTSLGNYCSTVDGESIIDTMQKVASATKLFTYPLIIQTDSQNVDLSLNQKETSDQILMLKRRFPNTDFIFDDTNINLTNDHSADITTTLRLETKTVDGQFTDAYEIHATIEKINGEWLFTSFAVAEFMKK